MLRIILPFSSPDLGYSEAGGHGKGANVECDTPWHDMAAQVSGVQCSQEAACPCLWSTPVLQGCGCWSWKHSKITVLMIREGGGWMDGSLEEEDVAAGC